MQVAEAKPAAPVEQPAAATVASSAPAAAQAAPAVAAAPKQPEAAAASSSQPKLAAAPAAPPKPVMVSTAGDSTASDDAVAAFERELEVCEVCIPAAPSWHVCPLILLCLPLH